MTFESIGAGSIGTAGEKDIPAHRLEFDTTGKGGLIGLHIANVIFMALTLMIYRFWAITRVRKALWSRLRFDGAPLEYTGTGLEIFKGFLRVVGLIFVPFVVIVIAVGYFVPIEGNEKFYDIFGYAQGFFVYTIYTLGRFLAFRYRINRTHWRGIRVVVKGAEWDFFSAAMTADSAKAATFWIAKPWSDVKIIDYKLSNIFIGDYNITFSRTTSGMWFSYLTFWLSATTLTGYTGYLFYKSKLLTYLLTFFFSTAQADPTAIGDEISILHTLSFIILCFTSLFLLSWYRSTFWRSVCEQIRFRRLEPVFRASSFDFFRLSLGNLALMIVSAGLLAPLVWLRKGAFIAVHLDFRGTIEYEDIPQGAFDKQTTGEGLLGDFDVA